MDETKGLLWRIIFTILVGAASLISALVYVAFYALGYSTFQKVAVVLIALIAAGAAISIVWVSWSGRRGIMHWGKW